MRDWGLSVLLFNYVYGIVKLFDSSARTEIEEPHGNHRLDFGSGWRAGYRSHLGSYVASETGTGQRASCLRFRGKTRRRQHRPDGHSAGLTKEGHNLPASCNCHHGHIPCHCTGAASIRRPSAPQEAHAEKGDQPVRHISALLGAETSLNPDRGSEVRRPYYTHSF